MEQNVKQHTLTLEKGLTSVPSDLVCDDNTLSSADGLVYLDGEYKPLQNPVDAGISRNSFELAFVHRLNDGVTSNSIYISGQNLYVNDSSAPIIVGSQIKGVKSIGNTLILSLADGLHYFLWKADTSEYKDLGSKIPEPAVSLKLVDDKEYKDSVSVNGLAECRAADGFEVLTKMKVTPEDFTSFGDAVIGLYAQVKNKISKAGSFINPFFVRYALELYDGTYTYISNPILMHTYFGDNMAWEVSDYEYADPNYTPHNLILHSFALKLMVKQTQDYSEYSDLVTGVTLFITNPAERYRSDIDDVQLDDDGNRVWYNYKYYSKTSYDSIRAQDWGTISQDIRTTHYVTSGQLYWWDLLSQREVSEIVSTLKTTSVFFKLCELGKHTVGDSTWADAKTYYNENVVTNITTQISLKYDDYYSHCVLSPTLMQTFNRRLNIANVTRSFFDGFDAFCNVYTDGTTSRQVYVRIKTPSGDRCVVKTIYSNDAIEKGYWFFYPDTRADHFWVVKGTDVFDADLTEHTGLNGAYYLFTMPDKGGFSDRPTSVGESTPSLPTTPELLDNYLIQSEVDNPFAFLASGHVRVGQGTIIGMAGLTTALSQDAYKVATTLIFTTQGIWALKINDEGQYTSVAPSFSREVCSYANTITMTDDAVFFVSKKGLMCVTGATESSVVCVSSQLKDSAFVSYCNSDKCRIAYDYKEQLLYVVRTDSEDAYIYSITTGTWTYDSDIFNTMNTLLTVVPDYPDTYLQSEGHTVYSFLKRDNRNDDSDSYKASFETRPVKFDGSLILDSIRQLKHLCSPDIKICHTSTEYASATTPAMLLTIKGSNDLINWSADIPSLKGKPYKFFKFYYTFKNLTATSTFAGTSVIVQQRYTEKML